MARRGPILGLLEGSGSLGKRKPSFSKGSKSIFAVPLPCSDLDGGVCIGRSGQGGNQGPLVIRPPSLSAAERWHVTFLTFTSQR